MPVTRYRFLRLAGVLMATGVLVVAAALWARTLAPVQAFVTEYPGHAPLPSGAPVGIPAWLAWQHFLNAFFLLLIVRTGWIIRSKQRPPAFWTRKDSRLMGLTGRRQRLGVFHWFHLVLDALWLANGVLYIVLLFATGQWVRIVPTDWSVLPHAASAALQYASFDWPTDSGWVNYNALQQLSYFVVVFLLAPIALITGLRLSPRWPLDGPLVQVLPERPSRWLHGVSLYAFVGFVIVHVVLVLGTGALRNLNVMYGGNDGESWLGAGVFALSVGVMAAGWLAATPALLKRLAGLSGEVR